MNNNGVAIRYGDVAPEAKENFAPTASESEFNTLSQLQRYNLNFPNYANPCETYSVALDGTATAVPSVPELANVGMWSEQTSGIDGSFTNPIILTLTSDGQYTSQGLTLTFDVYNGVYPTRVFIQWYRGDALVSEKDFYPNSTMYFCQNKVEYYSKITLTFYSLNMPNTRLKLRAIDYGYGTYFYGDELRNVKLIQEIDPISSEISVNTADFTLDSKSSIEYFFQTRQPLSVYFNGELKATTFVKSSKRKAKFLWDIKSEDYVGLLDSVLYYGGIYTNANAVAVLSDIFAVAKVPYSIDEAFAAETITGHIPYTTCRDALMQVAFAIQAVVDTSNIDYVRIYALDEKIKQTLPLNRIMQGQNFDDEATVTSVEVTSHTYKRISETLEAYDASESGAGQNIFVKFSEPLYDLTISNGTVLSSGPNYAVINANSNAVLVGHKYEHTTATRRKNNPDVLSGEIENVIAIENATLVSNSNVDKILEKCYNWLVNTQRINLRIVEGKHVYYDSYVKYGQKKYGSFKYGSKEEKIIIKDKPVNVGDTIKAETEYLGIRQGVVISQRFGLNGNIIIKDTQMR